MTVISQGYYFKIEPIVKKMIESQKSELEQLKRDHQADKIKDLQKIKNGRGRAKATETAHGQ